ncbi:hypothetical protein HPP92_004076 [Vanilla planifolia]|uniref:RRM domain-containing protein n=1 Tax=Vanilla planifolia TaxID=51239 RepID=A0A835S4B7_VANPL|nr:hypothetical protein HPP92_004076 [Vanilla planifolia]
MARKTACTVYIGNLDEKVTERVLYEILIQAGHVVDLYLPQDKESKNHKGFAFAEYETEEVANYAVRLFSGLVRLNNKTLKFAISGQDKPSNNTANPAVSRSGSRSLRKPTTVEPRLGDRIEPSHSMTRKDADGKLARESAYHYSPAGSSVAGRFATSNFEYSRRVVGAMLNGVSHSEIHKEHPRE